MRERLTLSQSVYSLLFDEHLLEQIVRAASKDKAEFLKDRVRMEARLHADSVLLVKKVVEIMVEHYSV